MSKHLVIHFEEAGKKNKDFKFVLSGKDPQLERAVKEMLEEIKKNTKKI